LWLKSVTFTKSRIFSFSNELCGIFSIINFLIVSIEKNPSFFSDRPENPNREFALPNSSISRGYIPAACKTPTKAPPLTPEMANGFYALLIKDFQ
jgi:hypothetical protein